MDPSTEHQLAYLGFQLIMPKPLLRPYVSSHWYFERPTPLPIYREEFMHPAGGFGIVFNLGDPLRMDGRIITAPVFLDGANTVTRRMGFMGHIEMMGIQFHAGGAFPFLGIPLIELQNETNVLDALYDPSLLRLSFRLFEARSMSARINLMEVWLMERLTLVTTQSSLIPVSLARLRQEITQHRGGKQSTIPEIADDLAISQRRLEDLYRSQVGMTPVQYLRLQRIEIARLKLSQKLQSNIQLAAELGYHDQAHFIHDFRSVIGTTPYTYMRRKHQGSP